MNEEIPHLQRYAEAKLILRKSLLRLVERTGSDYIFLTNTMWTPPPKGRDLYISDSHLMNMMKFDSPYRECFSGLYNIIIRHSKESADDQIHALAASNNAIAHFNSFLIEGEDCKRLSRGDVVSAPFISDEAINQDKIYVTHPMLIFNGSHIDDNYFGMRLSYQIW